MEEKYKELKYDLPDLELNPEEKKTKHKKISCPVCGTDTPAENLNINDMIAKCGSCDVVFPFKEEIAKLNRLKLTNVVLQRPKGINVFSFAGTTEITVTEEFNWIDSVLSIVLFAAIIPIIGAFKDKMSFLPAIIMVAIPLLYWLYRLVTKTDPTSYVTIDSEKLVIGANMSIKGESSYAVEDIDQIYVKQVPDMGIWRLMGIINSEQGQNHIKLVGGIQGVSKARYLEQQIEKSLNIVDREVVEEYKAQ